MSELSPTAAPPRPRDLVAVVVALVLPTIVTWLYFFQADDMRPAAQLLVFNTVKTVQFCFPLFWVLAIQRGRVTLRPTTTRGIDVGITFGGVVAATMFALYLIFLRASQPVVDATEIIIDKVSGWGINEPWKYGLLGLFYALIHSFLEEYYWRWFVFGQLRRFIPLWPAAIISALGFMAHHVLVLGKFCGFDSPLTYFLSACVAIGGAFWAWLYDRSGSLMGPWLGHMLIDAAIFAIGFDLIRGYFAT
ncbi:CPBP family intramembrane glutamic endopeptidase [Lacipirellula parvula]|uniref:CAAX amino terminal protease family protein n=1 Tax=Lacipirellula parvula TaxID=2650471 RepID=A0A5K7X7P1_9BACT|nr:CPBP family intramembrane glutamic endopeptidase [Lacipirellula parvula]BBO32640.1 CAAX amino terminal protease family protein [Lacipirellula parvula]